MAAGGSGVAGQGFAGGDGTNLSATQYSGGGGGGSSAVGAAGVSGAGGVGGAGTASTIRGASTNYSGGGGGGGTTSGGAGGLGGGGLGSNSSIAGAAGTTNTGSGGGGGGLGQNAGTGGSGIVVVRYTGTQKYFGGTVTTVGLDTVHTFLQSALLVPFTALGFDSSGNNNHWVTANFGDDPVLTTYDRMTDVPFPVGITVANFSVLSPLTSTAPFALIDGNLNIPATASKAANSTLSVTTGKWYWEITSIGTQVGYMGVTSYATENDPALAPVLNGANPRSVITNVIYKSYTGTGFLNLPAPPALPGGVYAFALDLTAGTLDFYKDGTLFFTDSSIPTNATRLYPYISHASGVWALAQINFGQQPFRFTPPAGFLEINTFNLSV